MREERESRSETILRRKYTKKKQPKQSKKRTNGHENDLLITGWLAESQSAFQLRVHLSLKFNRLTKLMSVFFQTFVIFIAFSWRR